MTEGGDPHQSELDNLEVRKGLRKAVERVEEKEHHKAMFCLKCGASDSVERNNMASGICDHDGLFDKENGPIVYKVRNGVDQITPILIYLKDYGGGGESSSSVSNPEIDSGEDAASTPETRGGEPPQNRPEPDGWLGRQEKK